ncbi:cytochrome b-c1 complex subunit 10 [Thalassophryne amazonica]|uniref:cytochrome b-c1 complex subunit 10 n=1 Tax=Thalassophryne amazonica TaxID=390379 RepID=UPI0014709C15|nr:cytochrome b-c1 complex subunit 10 [Thalassophryne amazonica]XP_034039753.1 cytochrome b-c1 complex subunit 10 [Thalassophryne amazonica]
MIVSRRLKLFAKAWTPNMAVWGAALGVTVIHFTDWRLVLDYVPYIRGKFKKDD